MNLSQDEINALLSGGSTAVTSAPAAPVVDSFLMEYVEGLAPGNGKLTDEEIDTLGEVGNICMGAVATAMYTLLDHRVDITTPRVDVLPISEVLARFPVPVVLVEVEYVEGIIGRNMLLLKEYDAALITDLLMGGDGNVDEPVELGELHMSAINEIMNQMTGASATALSQLLGHMVNISTPVSYHMKLADDIAKIGSTDLVIVITFDMEIESLLRSQLVQFMPYDVGRAMSSMLTSGAEPKHESNLPAPPPQVGPAFSAPLHNDPYFSSPLQTASTPVATGFERPVQPVPGDLVDVRPLHFQSFDEDEKPSSNMPSGIDSIYNIPLTVAAELGTTTKFLSDVLNFQPGVVFMLEKSAGDPVEVLVNGKRIARGEVVIIDDNYGVRITELPED